MENLRLISSSSGIPGTQATERPVRVLQFGEGNFLRAFCDLYIQYLNDNHSFNGNIVVVKPTRRGGFEKFIEQDCLYTVELLDGEGSRENSEKTIVNSISRVISPYSDFHSFLSMAECADLEIIISNTTEAGIEYLPSDSFTDSPQESFPGKLTRFLYERYSFFHGDNSKGLRILPCELIDDNAGTLKKYVLRYAEAWELGDGFLHWVNTACSFHNTLVDRIVAGFPKRDSDELFGNLGYEDLLYVTAEKFGLWVIEDNEEKLRSIIGSGSDNLTIVYTSDSKPYKKRKVRILNGAHTLIAPVSVLCGKTLVSEAVTDPAIRRYLIDTMEEEVLPYLSDEVEEPEEFFRQTLKRFENPRIEHSLKDICLNTISKWETRCLPSVNRFMDATGKIPKRLIFSLAAAAKYCEDNHIEDSLDKLALLENALRPEERECYQGYLNDLREVSPSKLLSDF